MPQIIDCHTHITKDGKWFNTTYDASLDTLLLQMDEAGVEKSVILPLFAAGVDNKFYAEVQQQYSSRIISFGAIHLESWREDVKEIQDLGLKGIKIHSRVQSLSYNQLDDSGFLEWASGSGIPLLFCGWTQCSTLPIHQVLPLNVDHVAKKYPELKIIIAHLGGHRFWDAFFCARANKNVYLDTSYFLNFFEGTSLESDFWAIMKKLDQKLIYGSDFPEVSVVDYLNNFREKMKNTNADEHAVLANNLTNLI